MESKISTRRSVILIAIGFIGCCSVSVAQDGCKPLIAGSGVIVESIVQGRQAAKLGLRAGDTILAWRRNKIKSTINSPFDLAYVEIDQSSRGQVALYGYRGRQRHTWLFRSEPWGLRVRPRLLGKCLAIYREGIKLAVLGHSFEASRDLKSIANSEIPGLPWLSPWIFYRLASALFHAQKWQESDEAFQESVRLSKAAGPIVQAEISRQWGSTLDYRGEAEKADAQYREALLAANETGIETMQVAYSEMLLGAVALEREKMDEAGGHLVHALRIAEQQGPHSSLISTIYEDIGILYQNRSDLEHATEFYLKALRTEERYSQDFRQLAATLTNLGILAHQRGDLSGEESYHRRALGYAAKIEENQLQLGEILSNLGECLLQEGNPKQAEIYQKRSLAMREYAAPDALPVASTLASLGNVARILSRFDKSEDYYNRAIAMAVKAKAPELDVAWLLTGEGHVFRDRHQYVESEDFYRRALAIVSRQNPGSIDHAELLAELADILRRQGQFQAASEFYPTALDSLESRALHLGGVEEDRSRYRAVYLRFYQGYIETLLHQKKEEQAFELLERLRARTLLEMLSQGHIDFRRGADPAVIERERGLQQLLQAKTEARVRPAAVGQSDEKNSHLDLEIEGLLGQLKDIRAELMLNSPEYAALAEPTPLRTLDIQKLLDENTILLEYSLGKDVSHLWVVSTDSLLVYDLPPKAEIDNVAHKMYDLLALRNPKAGDAGIPSSKVQREYELSAQKLGQMILGPVARALGKKRLLIVSDGSLQYVPFAALPSPDTSDDSGFLVLRHEIVNLPSASVLAELRREAAHRLTPKGVVAVIADPVFNESDSRVVAASVSATSENLATRSADLVRSANDLGLSGNGRIYLNRLLYTRREAKAVLAFVEPGKGFSALDFDASRRVVMSGKLADYRIVHFATHGLLNNKHPELSGLVFSLVDRKGRRQEGFLKLQNVYDLKLAADLVVLSACETGLGQAIDGEGLIGLTRGFMYAGATRVLASLWGVSDAATASFMAEFYRAMQEDGMLPAAALRAAQLHMLAQPLWHSPFYWAAFQLQGEWR